MACPRYSGPLVLIQRGAALGREPCTRAGESADASLLARCYTINCTCCVVTATSANLDSIVEFGLKNGAISIQEEAASRCHP